MAEALQEFDTSFLQSEQSETEPVINTAVLKINIITDDVLMIIIKQSLRSHCHKGSVWEQESIRTIT